MSDVFCNACNRHHASLTVCPNVNIMDAERMPPLCRNCVGVASLEAEIARLKAREAEMREALERALVWLEDEPEAKKLTHHVRALLSRESAEPAEERPFAKCIRKKDDCDLCGPPAWEGFKPAEERGTEVSLDWLEETVELARGVYDRLRAEVEARMKEGR